MITEVFIQLPENHTIHIIENPTPYPLSTHIIVSTSAEGQLAIQKRFGPRAVGTYEVCTQKLFELGRMYSLAVEKGETVMEGDPVLIRAIQVIERRLNEAVEAVQIFVNETGDRKTETELLTPLRSLSVMALIERVENKETFRLYSED